MTLFIKSYDNECTFVKTFNKEGNVYIDNALIIDIKSLYSTLNIEINNLSGIDMIQYDASIYVNDGFDLRKHTDIPILMYRSKNRFKDRITPEMENVKSFIFRATQSDEYFFFMG